MSDYENAAKEAVCSLEAAAKGLFPFSKGKTLGEVLKDISGSKDGQIKKPLAESITGLYAFRNSGEGVSHSGTKGGKVTKGIAEYVLASTASQIICSMKFQWKVKDVPF